MIVRELIAKFGLNFDDKAFKKADSAVNELKESARKLVEIFAVFETVKAFANVVSSTLQTADVMSKAAEKIGITTEELERLRYAGDLAGISAESMDHALTLFTKKAGDAANGNTEAIKSFAELGVKINDANGKIKASDVLLGDVADKMKDAKSKTERLRIAMDFFGARGGSAFVALLKDGSQGLNATKAELGVLGAEFSGKFGRDAEDFNDNMTRIGYVVKGLKNTLAEALLPTLEHLALRFLAWTKQNQAIVKSKIVAAVQSFIRFGRLAGGVALTFGRGLATVVDAIGGVRNAIIVLGAAFTLFSIVKIGEAVAAFATFTAAEGIAKAAMIADAGLMGAAFIVLAAIIGLTSEEIASNFSDTDGVFKKLSGKWGELTEDLIGAAYDSGVSWQGFFDLLFAGFSGEINIVDQITTLQFELFDHILDLGRVIFDTVNGAVLGILHGIEFVIDAVKRLGSVIGDTSSDLDTKFGFKDLKIPGVIGRAYDFLNSPIGGSVTPSPAVVAASATSAPSVGPTSVSVHVDASGQSLDEGQLATILTDRIHETLTTINAQTINALTPSAVRP